MTTTPIRTRSTQWAVQVVDGEGRWHNLHTGTRACEAFKAFEDAAGQAKRLLRNGRVLPMTDDNQETLWEA